MRFHTKLFASFRPSAHVWPVTIVRVHARPIGVRPSPGAARSKFSNAQGCSDTQLRKSTAAPGDGRTPFRRWPAAVITNYALLTIFTGATAGLSAPVEEGRSQAR